MVRSDTLRALPRVVAATALCAAHLAAPALAQGDDERPPLPARSISLDVDVPPVESLLTSEIHARELDAWIREYTAWAKWFAEWRNTPEPGWMGSRDRRQRPDPPVWLSDACVDPDESVALGEACRLLSEWKDDLVTAMLRERTLTARTQSEAPTKSAWWSHLHMDAMWPMTQWGSCVYGVIGMHATIELVGRLQVFIAPGIMLLILPSGPDAHELKPAADWGFTYRICKFRFPGSERRANLHLNLAKAWIFGGPEDVVGTSVNLAGFSITFDKTPGP